MNNSAVCPVSLPRRFLPPGLAPAHGWATIQVQDLTAAKLYSMLTDVGNLRRTKGLKTIERILFI